ncbi:MAG: hypothetical protein BWK78_02305 [Thiotrichaceae bacterium IS1]|nr:MAG: hypothetical protein BWK78_02305 [Thiotrichaceae bacterium IS1]
MLTPHSYMDEVNMLSHFGAWVGGAIGSLAGGPAGTVIGAKIGAVAGGGVGSALVTACLYINEENKIRDAGNKIRW